MSRIERIYGLVLLAYPREFRLRHHDAMRMVFADLTSEPGMSRRRLAAVIARDAVSGLVLRARAGGAITLRAAFFGLIVVGSSIAASALHPGRYLGFSVIPIPFLAFIAAGFWGARTYRSCAAGLWVCVVMGAVSGTMVFWDWLLFRVFPFPDAYSFLLTVVIEAAFCMVPGAIGAIAGRAAAVRREEPLPLPPSTRDGR